MSPPPQHVLPILSLELIICLHISSAAIFSQGTYRNFERVCKTFARMTDISTRRCVFQSNLLHMSMQCLCFSYKFFCDWMYIYILSILVLLQSLPLFIGIVTTVIALPTLLAVWQILLVLAQCIRHFMKIPRVKEGHVFFRKHTGPSTEHDFFTHSYADFPVQRCHVYFRGERLLLKRSGKISNLSFIRPRCEEKWF